MNKTNFVLAFLALGAISFESFSYNVTHTIKKIDANKLNIEVTFTLKPKEFLYKQGFMTSVNNPDIKLSNPEPSSKPIQFFDETSKKEKEGYKDTVTFVLQAQKEPKETISDALAHIHFSVTSLSAPQEKIIPLHFDATVATQKKPDAMPEPMHSVKPSAIKTQLPACDVQQPSLLGTAIQKTINWVQASVSQARHTLTSLFTSTGSHIIRFLAALILGLLLSLTPCIYPMIPITIGILQASGSSSSTRNFFLALSYTLGISTTFAILGFIAAIGSCVFGELQGSPWVVIPLALLLIYFALSMFDWVNLYIPRFMQPKTGKLKGGSPLSAYLFGALSGTIASPCLSPGLVLILNYVTNITSAHLLGYLEGFVLLFLFGIGSSLPLLIIGTFSTSLHVLPKAGAWMVEIKKIVGLMLICMAFYQLSHLERLLPWHILVWAIVLTLFALGIYYYASIQAHDRPMMRRYKNIMGTVLIIAACFMMIQGQKALYDHLYPQPTHSKWLHDYDQAHAQALKEHKLLFIDIGATYCAACSHLDHHIFNQQLIQDALSHYVQLKIDSDVHTNAYEKVKMLYSTFIEGFPTYLVVDPKTNTVIKKWSVDIDQLSLEGLSVELAKNSARQVAAQ